MILPTLKCHFLRRLFKNDSSLPFELNLLPVRNNRDISDVITLAINKFSN